MESVNDKFERLEGIAVYSGSCSRHQGELWAKTWEHAQ
jgi:hypothetical protein